MFTYNSNDDIFNFRITQRQMLTWRKFQIYKVFIFKRWTWSESQNQKLPRIRIRVRIRIHHHGCGSADPDPHQNDTDPKHCKILWHLRNFWKRVLVKKKKKKVGICGKQFEFDFHLQIFFEYLLLTQRFQKLQRLALAQSYICLTWAFNSLNKN